VEAVTARKPRLMTGARTVLDHAKASGESAGAHQWSCLDRDQQDRYVDLVNADPGWMPEAPWADAATLGVARCAAARATFQAAFYDTFLRALEVHRYELRALARKQKATTP